MATRQPHPESGADAYDLPVIEVTAEEGRRLFDEMARTWTGMSGEEFIARWEAGEYADLIESEDNRRIIDLIVMIPLGR